MLKLSKRKRLMIFVSIILGTSIITTIGLLFAPDLLKSIDTVIAYILIALVLVLLAYKAIRFEVNFNNQSETAQKNGSNNQ